MGNICESERNEAGEFKPKYTEKESAAIIQKYWRGFKARKNSKTRTGKKVPQPDMKPKVKETYDKLGVYSWGNALANPLVKDTYEVKDEQGRISYYTGFWMNGLRHGWGRNIDHDGVLYEGRFEYDKMDGRGRKIYVDGSYYVGSFFDGGAHGKGQFWDNEGGSYDGEWKFDLEHGKGMKIWPDNSKYTGDYSEGKRHGHGVFTWKDGSCYEGYFANDNMEGQGEYKWHDGRRYKGQWKDNKMHGKGEYWNANGYYNGDFKEDKKEGFGEYTSKDNKKYQGQWKNNKQDGRGEVVGKDGQARKGIWEAGKRIEWLKE